MFGSDRRDECEYAKWIAIGTMNTAYEKEFEQLQIITNVMRSFHVKS